MFFNDKSICLICKEVWTQSYICRNCQAQFQFEVRERDLEGLEKVYSLLRYDKNLKGHIYSFKYKRASYYGKVFGSLMGQLVGEMDFIKRVDYIIAIPLHRKRQNIRGYNQASLLAKYLGEETGIEVLEDCLIRRKNTKNQHKLSKYQREENLKGAFSLEKDLGQAIILLVDDIYTTGATLKSASSHFH